MKREVAADVILKMAADTADLASSVYALCCSKLDRIFIAQPSALAEQPKAEVVMPTLFAELRDRLEITMMRLEDIEKVINRTEV